MKTLLRPLVSGLSALALAVSLSSCMTPYPGPNESAGGVIGALGGAAAGAIIGNQSGRPLEGAAIGGALGALAGSAVGNANDQVYGRPYSGNRYYNNQYYSSSYYPRTTYVYRDDYYYAPPPVTYRSYSVGIGGCYAPSYYGYGGSYRHYGRGCY